MKSVNILSSLLLFCSPFTFDDQCVSALVVLDICVRDIEL